MVIGLASKKPARLSQYRRAAETPVSVSQYRVRLSRMSSRVSSPGESSLEDAGDQAGLAGAVAVVDREGGEVDR